MAQKTEVVELKKVETRHLKITIEGITPLLQNKMRAGAKQKIIDNEDGQKSKKQPRDSEKEFKQSMHVIDEKKEIYGVNAMALKMAMIRMAYNKFEIPMTESPMYFYIYSEDFSELIPIIGSKPVMDARITYLKRTTATMCYRGRFDKWKLTFIIKYTTDISRESLLNILNAVGGLSGIGSYRLEKKGIFGQFKISEVNETR